MAITRLFQSGAESGVSEVTGATNWGDLAISIRTDYARTGSYAYRVDVYNDYFWFDIPATRQIRYGFSMLQSNCWPTSQQWWQRIRNAAGSGLGGLDFLQSTAYLQAGSPVAVQDTAIGVHGLYQWIHFGIDVKIDSSSGWFYVYKDGILILDYSGNTGNSDITRVLFGGNQNNHVFYYVDDIYIDDTTGEGAAAAPPMKRFNYVTVNEDGYYSSPTGQWDGSDGNQTDNYALVDEVPASSADYVSSQAADELDSYTMTTFTLGANQTIDAVIPVAVARKNGLTEQLAIGTRYSSTDAIGSDQNLATPYMVKMERQTTKPGGGAWDQSALDDFEVVIKSRGSY